MREFDRLDLVVRSKGVDIFVNEVAFIDLVRTVELPYATADGQPDLAGDYDALGAELMLAPSMHLMGAPDTGFSYDGKPFLLGCTCGEAGCWPLLVDVEIGPDTVTWRAFEHGFRDQWSYEGLGPFVFNRSEYERALRTQKRA